MGQVDTSYFEGMTAQDAESLRLILEAKQVDPSSVRRLRDKGWIEPCGTDYLITLAGRCVIDSAKPHATGIEIREARNSLKR